MTTSAFKSKNAKEEQRSQTAKVSGRKQNGFDLSSCLGDDVTHNVPGACEKTAVYGSKMIVNNAAVTHVYALWYITMCAGHVSQLLIIILWFINLF